jgi:hypothetical protein
MREEWCLTRREIHGTDYTVLAQSTLGIAIDVPTRAGCIENDSPAFTGFHLCIDSW